MLPQLFKLHVSFSSLRPKYPSPENLSSPPVFSEVRVNRSLVVCVIFCRSLFVLLPFIVWPLCCLFVFDLRILITALVSSITTKAVISNPVPDGMYSIQHYVIKFVSHLRQVGGFLQIFRSPAPIKLTVMI